MAAGVIVSSCGTGEYDIVSRYLAPKIGINEDSVTGSEHYWGTLLNKKNFFAYQASERWGEIRLKVMNNNKVQLSGNCVSFMQGSLYI